MTITFTSPKTIITVPQATKTLSSLTIIQMVDIPSEKRVVVYIAEIGRVVLWDSAAYDAIGQWTDTDVINRINELYP